MLTKVVRPGIGLYGVLAYQTVRRRGEIGIRLALGATRGQIMQLVLMEAGLLVFTVSLDTFGVTFCKIGSPSTLPMYIWSQVEYGVTPSV